jgi:hypothetical protein
MPENPKIGRGSVISILGTGPRHDAGRPHKFVVLTEPDSQNDILVVPICSYEEYCDEACVVHPNEAPSIINHESYIQYNQGKKILMRQAKYAGKVSSSLLSRIETAVFKSDDVADWFVKQFKDRKKAK